MSQVTIDMPMVSQCSVTECAYNLEKKCHARAITIGNGIHPGCDTFFMTSGHVHEKKRMAGIGACKVGHCKHNADLECMAASINVARSGDSVSCMTFMAR
jgi:hypothetical protein